MALPTENKNKILIVEDENIVALDMELGLRRLGYEVYGPASRGTEAVELATRHRPNLILMDIQLKGDMDGIEAATLIKERLHIPVVFLTAHADEPTLQRALKSEPYGYLLKPFEETELRTVVETVLYKHQAMQSTKQKADEALFQSEEHFRLLVDSVEDYAIFTLDPDGLITSWNPGVGRIMGYNAEEIIGQPLSILYTEEQRRQQLPQQKLALLKSHNHLEEEGWLIRKDGTPFWAQITCNGILSPQGRLMGYAKIIRDLTQAKRTQRLLEERERQFRELAERVHLIPWRAEPGTGRFTYVGPQAAQMLGYPLEDWYEPDFWFSHMHPQDREWVPQHCKEQSRQRDHYEFEYRMLAADGRVVWFHDMVQVERDEQGSAVLIQGFLIDISSLKETQEQLAREKERAQVTLQSIGDAVITTDSQHRIESLNPVAEQITGWTTAEAIGRPVSEVFRLIEEETRAPVHCPIKQAIEQKDVIKLKKNCLLITKQGQELSVEDSAAPIRQADGRIAGAVLVFHDVTESRRTARHMLYHASHDELTDLINRREFEIRLRRTIEHATQHGSNHALLYMDLDQFKVVNDSCGHSAGDELLKQLAMFLSRQVRDRDTLARLGGDEFALLMEHCTLSDAIRVANKLLETVRSFRFYYNERAFAIGMSIGLVPIDATSVSSEQVMQQADHACYTAKDAGRHRLHIQRPDDEDLVQRRKDMGWVSRLGEAVQNDQLGLFYQAIHPLGVDHVEHTQYEVLVRLRHAGQWVTPGVFLGAAERYDLMPLIDRWVVTQAIRWLHRQPEHLQNLNLCMLNLSARTLSDEAFLHHVLSLLDDLNFPAHKICFEITETTAISHPQRALEFINRLKTRGCYFALDDFGTGMASFSYLKLLPVDFLKIDGSFVETIAHNAVDYEMVKSINEISHIMGKCTIAEKVSDARVLECLNDIGVDFAQGFWLGKPEPLFIPEAVL